MSRKTLGILIAVFFALRIFSFVISYFSDNFLLYAPTFPYANELLPLYDLPRWVYSWANFDGVHYLTIIEKGYVGTGLIQAFFPMYPMVSNFLNKLVSNEITAALIVSNVSLLGSLLLLYLLVKKHFNRTIAWWSIVAFCFFPTMFYSLAVYSESLFLFFVLAAFYFVEVKKWMLVSVSVALASATRLVGISLVPAIILGLAMEHNKNWLSFKSWKKFAVLYAQEIFFVLLGSVGLLAYMFYLWSEFKDPLYFWHVQEEFGGGRQESIVLIPQIVWRYFKILATVDFNLRWWTYIQELFYGIVPLCLIIYIWTKTKMIPHSWSIFSILTLIIPTLTGTFSSMPRYTLIVFPLYVLLGIAYNQYPRLRWLNLISVSMLVFNTVLFIQGYWVA